MNKQTWLIAGLSLAMAASLGLSACGGGKTPETPPTTEHTHTYTEWKHDSTQHWLVCPDDGAEDPAGKSPHEYVDGDCECGAQLWEVYVMGHIASYPGSEIASVYRQRGASVPESIAKNCPKMTLGEDGKTYTAEVYLIPTDYFAIYCYTTTWAYPLDSLYSRGNDPLMISPDEPNTYLITWVTGDEKASIRVHDHKYTGWKGDDAQHWKVCPSDGTVDPDFAKEAHDFSKGNCVCGAVESASCPHANGYSFAYEEVPAAQAEGGTLERVCPDCNGKQTVEYQKGFVGDSTSSGGGTLCEVDEGTYYFVTGDTRTRFGMTITKAGTYTVTFEEVCDRSFEFKGADGQLGLAGLTFGAEYDDSFFLDACIARGDLNVFTDAAALIKAYNVKVNGKTPLAKEDLYGNLTTLSFTVTEEQLAEGNLLVTFLVGGAVNDSHSHLGAKEAQSYFMTIKQDA